MGKFYIIWGFVWKLKSCFWFRIKPKSSTEPAIAAATSWCLPTFKAFAAHSEEHLTGRRWIFTWSDVGFAKGKCSLILPILINVDVFLDSNKLKRPMSQTVVLKWSIQKIPQKVLLNRTLRRRSPLLLLAVVTMLNCETRSLRSDEKVQNSSFSVER